MALIINDVVPNLELVTDHGNFKLHDFIGESWTILFSHPKDYTPVCTAEFGAVAQLAEEWERRNTKVIGLSVDSVEEHKGWKADIETYAKAPANFPIIEASGVTVARQNVEPCSFGWSSKSAAAMAIRGITKFIF